jgi:hypothetical protein
VFYIALPEPVLTSGRHLAPSNYDIRKIRMNWAREGGNLFQQLSTTP